MTNRSTIPAGFEDLRGRSFQERYAITELVAASPHRVTFGGIAAEGERPIVLVLLRPTALHDAATRERFERRVRACARLRHPSIGNPIDSGETLDGLLWLVYERPAGEPLDRYLAGLPAGRLPWADARSLLLELVRGLAAAHGRGVVHGSVSPACCWVHGVGSDAPTLRLLDWGSNSDPASDESDGSYSRTTTVGGDPVFMAPEAAGGIFGDERADAYLAGLVAWSMLVGRPLFMAGNAFQLVSMHMQSPVPAMRDAGVDVPAAGEAWVRALLAKEPQQRPASMTVIEQGLLAIDEHGEPQAVRAEEIVEPRGRRGRAKAQASARDQAAQGIRASERGAVQGQGRRLPGQEIVDPRAVIPPAAGSGVSMPTSHAAFAAPAVPAASPPSLPALPPTPPLPSITTAMAAHEVIEQTLAFSPAEHVAAPTLPVNDAPQGTVLLTNLRPEPRGGATPDATLRLGFDAPASDATLMLTGAELGVGAAAQPSTMVLGTSGGSEGKGAAASSNATMLAHSPGLEPGYAPTTVLSGAGASGVAERAAGASQGGTTVLGMGALGFEPRDHPAPAQRAMHAVPPAPVAPTPYVPPPVVPGSGIVQRPAQSRMGLWVAILALVAVAGVAVGLALGG